MKTFKSFGIKTEIQSFVGDKIKIDRILNREITVFAYKIEPSKFAGDRLDMQIAIGTEKHVVFTGSTILMDMVKQVPPNGFPFTTTIVKVNDRFEFT